MGVTYNQKLPHEGLMLMLDAGNKRSYPGTGTKWYDVSGHNHDGTPFTFNMGFLSGGTNPLFSTDNGGGFYFDGTISKCFFDADSAKRQDGNMDGITDFTCLMWVKPGSQSHTRYYALDTRLDDTYGIGMGLDRSGSGGDPFHFFSPSTGGYDEANDGTFLFSMAQDSYYMMGMKRIGDTMQILSPDSYTWRTPSFSSTSGGSGVVSLTDMRVGAYENNQNSLSNYWWKGYIYTVMVWNRQLTNEETKQVYNSFRGRFGV